MGKVAIGFNQINRGLNSKHSCVEPSRCSAQVAKLVQEIAGARETPLRQIDEGKIRGRQHWGCGRTYRGKGNV